MSLVTGYIILETTGFMFLITGFLIHVFSTISLFLASSIRDNVQRLPWITEGLIVINIHKRAINVSVYVPTATLTFTIRAQAVIWATHLLGETFQSAERHESNN